MIRLKRQFKREKQLLLLALLYSWHIAITAQETATAAEATTPAAESAQAAAADEAATTQQEASANDDIYVYRQKGLRALGDGFYGPAARFFLHYREAVEFQEPQFADATVLLVKAYLHQQQVAPAQEALDYHADKNDKLTDQAYKDALQYWQGAVLLAQGKWQAAADAVKTLAASSQTPEYRNLALELLGDAYIRLQEWQAAEQAMLQLLEKFPHAENALRAHLGLIKIYLATGNTERTNATIATVQENFEDAPALLLKLYEVMLHLQKEQLDEAYELYRSFDAQRPQRSDSDWWTAANQLSSALLAAGRYEDALNILPQAMVLAVSEDDRVQSMLQAAEARIASGKVMLAIDTLETFRKTYPERIEIVPVQLKLAELLRKTNSYVTASEYFQKVAENEKADENMRYHAAVSRGWCLREAGQPANAVKAFTEAADLAAKVQLPAAKQAEPLSLAGDTAFLIQNYAEAASYYQRIADKFSKTTFAQQARFRQARAQAAAKEFEVAAQIYALFLDEFPESELRAEAQLERGIALNDGGLYAEARQALQAFIKAFPQSAYLPRALMAAAQAARRDNDINAAVTSLSTVISDHTASDLYPHAVYQRAHLYFRTGRYVNAVTDARMFLEQFPLLPMATDVFMWMGDYYANGQELERSEEYFLKLITTHPNSEQAPTALYEAAKSAYHREDLTRSALLIEEFHKSYPNAPDKVVAQAHLLQGDIHAKQGKFAQAAEEFKAAHELRPATQIGVAALGRLGEMHYTIGAEQSDQDQEQLQKAVAIFQDILAAGNVSADMEEKVRYRLAKAYEKMGNDEAAMDNYFEIIYQYDLDQEGNQVRDWYYFMRSGYDLATLFLLNERYRDAARIYERLAGAGVPTADDVAAKAYEIREKHGLLD